MKTPIVYHTEYNFRESVLIIIMCSAIFLTRLPWLSMGYGMRPDSYRIVISARNISQTGEYIASRLPGYPVHEYLTAFTPAKSSPFFSNCLTSIFSCIAFLFFALILRYFHTSQYLLLTCAFAFTPIIYVNSVSTIDPMFAIAFALGSTYFVLVQRPFIAGICLGLAIGCRITSGAMILPLTIQFCMNERISIFNKRILIFGLSALAAGCICFLPVIHRYGINFFTFSENNGYPSMVKLLYYGILKVWGTPATMGLLGLCCLLPFFFQNIKVLILQQNVRQGIILSSLVIIIYIIAFLRLPQQSAYLIPVVPFTLMLVGLLLPTNFVRWFSIILILSSFIITINRDSIQPLGPIISDHVSRELQIKETRKIIDVVDHLQENAVIVAGPKLPQILVALGNNFHYEQDKESFFANSNNKFNHEYVYLIPTADTYKRFVEQARSVYFLDNADSFNMEVYKVNLQQLGAQQLYTGFEKSKASLFDYIK